MANYQYIVDILAKNGQFVQAMNQNIQKTGDLDKKIAAANKSTSNMMAGVGKLAGALGIAFSVGAVLNFGKATVQAYDQSIKAETALLTALKGRTDIQQRLISQATELMGKTLFDDDETVRAQSLVAAFVKEEDQIKSLIPLIQDFATAKQMDLAGAADLVTKTLAGEMNALGRYGLKVEGAAGSAERLAMIQKGLNDAFGGQSEAAAKVGTASLVQLGNEYGNLKEAVGKLLIEQQNQSGSFTKMLTEDTKALTAFFSKVSEYNSIGSDTFNSVLTMIAVRIGLVAQSTVDARIALGQAEKDLVSAANSEESNDNYNRTTTVVKTYADSIDGLSEKLKDYNEELKAISPNDTGLLMNKLAQINATEKQIDSIEKLKKAMQSMAEDSGIRAMKINPLATARTSKPLSVTGGAEKESDPYGAFYGSTATPKLDIKDFTGNAERIKTANEQMQAGLDATREKVQAVTGAFQQGFNQIGQSVLQGLGLAESGFEGFVGGLASTVIDLISMFLAQSIAASIAGASVSGASTGPAAIFTTPAFIATAIAGVMGAFAAIPAFADGGIISGPTYGLMGEYPGAANNPEVVAPLSKLKAMIGGGNNQPIILRPSLDVSAGSLRVMLHREDNNRMKRTGR